MKLLISVIIVGLVIPELEASRGVVTLTRDTKTCSFASSYIRGFHGVPPIEWDNKLAAGAEDWAIRCALKQSMDHTSKAFGENLFMTLLKTVSCAQPLRNWYKGIQNYNYDNPQWNFDDGTFLQEVYSTVAKFGVGQASHGHSVYVVGRYDRRINKDGPFDREHVPKPKKDSIPSINDLTPSGSSPVYIQVTIPDQDGWTEWTKTSQCSADCGVGGVTEERWCVRLKDENECDGSRKRAVQCEKKNCGPCKDLHMDCKPYADTKGYCKHAIYGPWMKKNCPNSCKFCTQDMNKFLVYDVKALQREKAKIILL